MPPPPPIATDAAASPPAVMIARLRPGGAVCGGSPVEGHVETPFATTLRLWSGARPPQGATYVLTFSIDADGRPTGIRRRMGASPDFYFKTSDLDPSLAASRFETGHPLADCALTYTIELTPIADAPLPLVHEVAAGPDVGSASGNRHYLV